ncbi:general stress protein [Microbacterium indicum]|uniref:general stress protein n=1 Tax=Microbacterium indicum TaxID=358100 RepID=UPI00041FE827|nr:general stress protein [Microbacterium indicum]
MSMMNGLGRAPEVGETVATYKQYEGAQRAVSLLISKEIPASDIAIVGSALRSVEKITGRLGWAQAAWQGALNGVLLGLLVSAFAFIWVPTPTFAMVGGLLLLGVAVGMLMRVLSYSLVRRRRDYASVQMVMADHYEVAVSRSHVTEARRLLGTTKPRTVVAAPPTNEPPQYGIRVVDGKPQQPQAPAETPKPAEPEGSAGPDAGEAPAGDQRD